MRRYVFWAALLAPLLAGCLKGGASSPGEGAAAGPRFREVAEAAGVRYTWSAPGKRPLNILQTIGNGCAFLDYDRDGSLDILLVGPKPALFQGDGKGRFADVSQVALGGLSGYFLGCAVGDVDGDGFADIYLSGYREGRLLKNEGGKGFKDVTAAWGLKPQPWGTACGFADLDADGFLDLYVGNYADFTEKTNPQLCKFRSVKHGDVMSSCGPTWYRGLPGVVYQNRGGKSFVDVTRAWGFTTQTGRTLGVAFADYDGSGRVSVSLANDEAPGDLFLNKGPGKFENVAASVGTSHDRDGKVHGGMGTDWGDYNNDGFLDLFVATFRNEVKNIYRNEGGTLFTDVGYAAGIGQPALPYVAFGARFLDADNDGWLDLLIANGHVQDNIELLESTSFRQPTQFFRNQGGTFTDASGPSGVAALPAIVGRGLASGDYDNDGRVDALVVDSEGRPLLLHNETAGLSSEGWVGFRCRNATGRDLYGAVLTIEAGGNKWVRQCQSAGSYLSASDPRVHFGLGNQAKVDRLTIRWPDGKVDTWESVPTGRYLTVSPGASPR